MSLIPKLTTYRNTFLHIVTFKTLFKHKHIFNIINLNNMYFRAFMGCLHMAKTFTVI